MKLSELRRLVRQYVDGEIAYAPFRAQFVADYLAVLHQDLEMERDVNAIENACADYDEQDISEHELRDDLSLIANRPTISVLWNAAPQPDSRSSRALYFPTAELVA